MRPDSKFLNNISLKMSTEASINLLQTSKPETFDLFLFLSCFPDGVKQDQVAKLMGNEQNIDHSLETLESLAFLEQADNKISLSQFIVKFIQTAIEDESKGRFMSTIS